MSDLQESIRQAIQKAYGYNHPDVKTVVAKHVEKTVTLAMWPIFVVGGTTVDFHLGGDVHLRATFRIGVQLVDPPDMFAFVRDNPNEVDLEEPMLWEMAIALHASETISGPRDFKKLGRYSHG